jgi:hypothetical protein
MNEEVNIPNNIETDKALKEFKTKSVEEQVKKIGVVSQAPIIKPKHEVEGVKFEIPSYGAEEYCQETTTPKMVQLVMKWFGFKEQKQAEYVLLGFVVMAITISLFLMFGRENVQQKPSAAMLEQFKLMSVNK